MRFVIASAILALLVVGVVVADNLARGYVADQIAGKVRSSLSVPASTPVEVSVGGTSVLLQLLSGKLDQVDVGLAHVALGELGGSADLMASGIPIDSSRPIDLARVVFVTDQADLQKLFSGIPGLSPDAITVSKGAVTLGTKVTLFGYSLPVGITFTPAARGGLLELTPTTILIGKQSFTAEQLKASAFGALADSLFVSHKVCVASLLPKGFSLESLSLSGSRIQLTVSAQKVVLGSRLMASRGSCPAA